MFLGCVCFMAIFTTSKDRQGLALHCYNCPKSSDISTCNVKQISRKCGYPDNQGVCMTLSYNAIKDDTSSSRYLKTCMTKSDCNGYCSLPGAEDVMKNCQAECCNTNLCNKKDFREIVYENKVKRSSNRKTNQAENSQQISKANLCFLLSNLLFVFIFVTANSLS